MDDKNVSQLAKEFPDQFRKEGTPCWSDCPDGWVPLVREVMQKVKDHGVKLKWHQIKEKFGTLRMYEGLETNSPSSNIYDWISKAERESGKTCEVCGKPGKTVNMGWLFTLCLEHKKERKKEKEMH